MKNKIFTLAILAFLFVSFNESHAQLRYQKGTLDMNLVTGFNTGWGFAPIHFNMNYNIMDFLSIGGEVGWNMDINNSAYIFNTYRWVRHGGIVTARSDYHFNDLFGTPDQFDIYAGIQIGVAFWGKYSNSDVDNIVAPSSSSTEFITGPHVGGRWYWSDKLGVNVETGFQTYQGVYIQGGLSFMMK